MSVEESRRDVRGDVAQHIEDELWDSGTWLEQRLDRLILEVRAEMPCYMAWCAGHMFIHPRDGQCSAEICPSCSARAELQKVAV